MKLLLLIYFSVVYFDMNVFFFLPSVNGICYSIRSNVSFRWFYLECRQMIISALVLPKDCAKQEIPTWQNSSSSCLSFMFIYYMWGMSAHLWSLFCFVHCVAQESLGNISRRFARLSTQFASQSNKPVYNSQLLKCLRLKSVAVCQGIYSHALSDEQCRNLPFSFYIANIYDDNSVFRFYVFSS